MAIYFGKNKQIKNCVFNKKFANPPVIGKTDIAGYFELDGCSNYNDLVNNLVIPSNYEISAIDKQGEVGDVEGISSQTLQLTTRKNAGTGDFVIKTKMACDYMIFNAIHSYNNSNTIYFTLKDTNGNVKLQVMFYKIAGSSIFKKDTYHYEVYRVINNDYQLITHYTIQPSNLTGYAPPCKVNMVRGSNKPYSNEFNVFVGDTKLCSVEIDMPSPLYAEFVHRVAGFGTTDLTTIEIYHYNFYKGIPQINS